MSIPTQLQLQFLSLAHCNEHDTMDPHDCQSIDAFAVSEALKCHSNPATLQPRVHPIEKRNSPCHELVLQRDIWELESAMLQQQQRDQTLPHASIQKRYMFGSDDPPGSLFRPRYFGI
jgi:hypothetical protein